MSDEWGSIAMNLPTDLRKALAGSNAAAWAGALRKVADFVGVEISPEQLALFTREPVTNKGGFVCWEFEGAPWTLFSEAIMDGSHPVPYYAWHRDEYGGSRFYSQNGKGRRVVVCEELEEQDEDDEEAVREDLYYWVSSLPVAVTRSFPDFDPLDPSEYSKPAKPRRKRQARKPQVNVTCYFPGDIRSEQILAVVDESFSEFGKVEPPSNGLLEWLLGGKEDTEQEPADHTEFNWFPISEDRSRTADELLSQLVRVTKEPVYANCYAGNSSFPYRIVRADREGIEEVFNTDAFLEDDLEMLCRSEDVLLHKKVNWMAPNLDDFIKIEQQGGLVDHANAQIRQLRAEIEAAEAADREVHEKIWAAHANTRVPTLFQIRFYLRYRKWTQEEAEAFAAGLQQRGMRKNGIERGIGLDGRNTLVYPASHAAAAEALKRLIPELADHRLIQDDDMGGVIINMS